MIAPMPGSKTIISKMTTIIYGLSLIHIFRLVGIPLATIAVLCVLRPRREVAMVLVIMNAMPVAANTVAAAQQAGLSSD